MRRKAKLSEGQKQRLSDVLGTVSVTWFSVGVISPLIIRHGTLFDIGLNFGLSIIMTAVSLYLSLKLMED